MPVTMVSLTAEEYQGLLDRLKALEDARATRMTDLAPVLQRLPFRSLLLASQDDPYCTFARAQAFASAWGSEFIDCGCRGHLNADSGLGDWPEGHRLVQQLGAAPAAA